MSRLSTAISMILLAILSSAQALAVRKPHLVLLGAPRKVAYSRLGDPAGASSDEKELRIRALIVDGLVKEWTTGEAHDITDRSFVIRRAIRLNDTLPGDAAKAPKWVWQRGPWLLIDRTTGHASLVKLPDYDPGVSRPVWFRDSAAYCGLSASGKQLYALVAQVAARKAILSKKIGAFDPAAELPACAPAEWQRDPLRVVFHPAGREPMSFALLPGSALLMEEADDEEASPAAANPPAEGPQPAKK